MGRLSIGVLRLQQVGEGLLVPGARGHFFFDRGEWVGRRRCAQTSAGVRFDGFDRREELAP